MGKLKNKLFKKNRRVFVHEVVNEGQKSATITVPEIGRIESVQGSHPAYQQIIEAAKADDPVAIELIDTEVALTRAFRPLSERLAVKNGEILVDGDPVNDALSNHLLKMLEQGENFLPIVKFYERLLTNPLGHAREALFPWLQGQAKDGITLTEDGKVVGYKSMFGDGEKFRPVNTGPNGGIVNGKEFPANTVLVQGPGDVVEMPRSLVLHAPSIACAEGLHIGTWGYAKGFTGDAKVEVHFDPRDVVSVPNTENKIRVSRYTLVGEVTEPRKESVVADLPQRTLKVPKAIINQYPATSGNSGVVFVTQTTKSVKDGYDGSASFANTTNTQTIKGGSISATAIKERVRYPKPAQFDALVAEAKSKKKGARSFIEAKTTWTLKPGGNPKDRKDWRA